MKRQNSLCTHGIAGSLTILGGAACAYFDTDWMEGRRMVTVTGCVQAAPGISNFVLSNVGAIQGAEPQQRQTYSLEGDRTFVELVGKQVQVRGELTATLDDSDTAKAANRPGDQLEFDDLGTLRVLTLETIDGTCGASFGS
jgi:hypothetical protein